jgi:hypothetical protein
MKSSVLTAFEVFCSAQMLGGPFGHAETGLK